MGQQSFLDRIDKTALGLGAALFALAFLLRFIGIGWGLPNETRYTTYHPDEPVNLAYATQVNVLQGDLTPGFYNYGTFYLVLTNLASSVASGYSPSDPKTFEGQLKGLQTSLFGARMLSVLLGAGMASLAFLLIFRRTHPLGALAAGLAVAVAPGLVVHSRFATVDIPAAFFGLLSLYWALRCCPIGDDEPVEDKTLWRFVLYAGAAAGLSAACKYSGGLAVLALVPILWSLKGKGSLPLLAGSAGMALLVFVLGVPGIFLESAAFWRDFTYELSHVAEGHGAVFMATSPAAIYHIGNLIEGFGLLLFLLGVAGLARASLKKHPWALGLAVFAVVTYILLARQEVKFLRYVFPLIPVLAVGAGWLAGQAHTHPKQQMKMVGFLMILALGGLGGGGLSRTITMTAWMAGKDPRDEAAEWIKANLKDGQKVGLVAEPWFQTPPLYPQANDHIMAGWEQRWESLQQSPIPIAFYVPPNPDERFKWDSRLLTELHPDYVVATSFEVDDYDRIAKTNPTDPTEKLFKERFLAFGKELQKDYELAAVFGADGPSVHDLQYIRPTMRIWKKKAASNPSSKSSSTASPQKGG